MCPNFRNPPRAERDECVFDRLHQNCVRPHFAALHSAVYPPDGYRVGEPAVERDSVFPLPVEEQSSALTPTAAWGASLSRWISDTGASTLGEPTQFDGNGNIRRFEAHLWRHHEPTAAPASGFRVAAGPPGPPAIPVVLCSVCGNPILKDERDVDCKACGKCVHLNCSSKCPGCSERLCTSCAVPHSMGCLMLAKMVGAELASPPRQQTIGAETAPDHPYGARNPWKCC